METEVDDKLSNIITPTSCWDVLWRGKMMSETCQGDLDSKRFHVTNEGGSFGKQSMFQKSFFFTVSELNSLGNVLNRHIVVFKTIPRKRLSSTGVAKNSTEGCCLS